MYIKADLLLISTFNLMLKIDIYSSRFPCEILSREARGSLRWRNVSDSVHFAESSTELHIDSDNNRNSGSDSRVRLVLLGVRFRHSMVQLRSGRASDGSRADGGRSPHNRCDCGPVHDPVVPGNRVRRNSQPEKFALLADDGVDGAAN